MIFAPGQSMAQALNCASEPYCTQMRSCAEADFYLRQCGHVARDGDGDGIPCEALCGDTMALYLQRREIGAAQTSGGAGLLSPAPAQTVTCGAKRTCGQMVSCAEARAYLTQCGVTSLDRDRDGTPCESICR